MNNLKLKKAGKQVANKLVEDKQLINSVLSGEASNIKNALQQNLINQAKNEISNQSGLTMKQINQIQNIGEKLGNKAVDYYNTVSDNVPNIEGGNIKRKVGRPRKNVSGGSFRVITGSGGMSGGSFIPISS